MRIICITILVLSITTQSCSLFKKSSDSTDSRNKGLDQTTLTPVEYNSSDRNYDYVTNYNRAAVLEMERKGVPASITLAQGILESGAGTSQLAQLANNHFGIKCGGDWNGKTYYKKDDDRDENGNLKESCFRKYNSVEESFIDHGEFLRDPRKANRYGYLFNLDRTDYKGWARGLQSAGYASSPDYANRLIDLIERYKLYEYDFPGNAGPQTFPGTPGAGDNGGVKPEGPYAPGTPASASGRIGRVNDVKVVASREGETLEDIARAYRINTDKVVDYNDRGYPPGVRLKPNTRIFIQCKQNQWRGRATTHTVREDQTMFDISQIYGIQLEKLLQRNGLARGQEPAVNERVRIRKSREPLEPIKLRNETIDPSPVGTKPPDDDLILDGTLDFDISPNETKTNDPSTSNPSTGSNPKPPATSGVPYPDSTNPGSSDPVPNRPTTETVETPVPPGYHRVVKGDTLYRLSKLYNTTVARLKEVNNLGSDNIQIGQVLKVK
ncbi:MAG: LysM peptidoglycan-binding domain-containing protein [Saprospiraceae bacterium]